MCTPSYTPCVHLVTIYNGIPSLWLLFYSMCTPCYTPCMCTPSYPIQWCSSAVVTVMLHVYTWLPNMIVFQHGGHSYATSVHLVTQYDSVPAWWSQLCYICTPGYPVWWCSSMVVTVMLHMYTWLPNMMVSQHGGHSYATCVHLVTQYDGVPALWSQCSCCWWCWEQLWTSFTSRFLRGERREWAACAPTLPVTMTTSRMMLYFWEPCLSKYRNPVSCPFSSFDARCLFILVFVLFIALFILCVCVCVCVHVCVRLCVHVCVCVCVCVLV